MTPIVLERISFHYPNGVAALRNVSLALAAGESVALIGQNGAGKTTLARHLNGLLLPSDGQVLVGDWNTRAKTAAQLAQRIGYVFQHPEHQIFKRTVQAEVAFGPRNLGFSAERVDQQVARALEATGLAAYTDRHPHDLLPALRKRVALASVIAMDTPIIVLDEPTTGQDAGGTALIGNIVDQLIADGRTVIMISHDMDFCADHMRRFVMLNQGRVVLDGPPEVVFGRPELLAESAVEPPQLARLAAKLGLPLAWQVESFVDTIARERGRFHKT